MFIDCTAQGLFTAIRSREWICSHFCTEDIRSVQLSEQMCRYGLNDSSSPLRVTHLQRWEVWEGSGCLPPCSRLLKATLCLATRLALSFISPTRESPVADPR